MNHAFEEFWLFSEPLAEAMMAACCSGKPYDERRYDMIEVMEAYCQWVSIRQLKQLFERPYLAEQVMGAFLQPTPMGLEKVANEGTL